MIVEDIIQDTPDLMILQAIDAIVARNRQPEFSVDDVVAELSRIGHPATTVAVTKLLQALVGRFEIGRRQRSHGVRRVNKGNYALYERYPKELRDAWREADAIAEVIGGEVARYTSGCPATITLTLEQARAISVVDMAWDKEANCFRLTRCAETGEQFAMVPLRRIRGETREG